MAKPKVILADLFDPRLGSEFQVPEVALKAIDGCVNAEVTLLTLRRAGNEQAIRRWLEERGLSKTVRLEFFDMRRAASDGSHSSRLAFWLDLVDFYLAAKRRGFLNGFVWKCGQINLLQNILFIAVNRCDVLGPLGGLESPRPAELMGLGLKFRVNYLLYGLVNRFAVRLLRRLCSSGRCSGIIFATAMDRRIFGGRIRLPHCVFPEVNIWELFRERAPGWCPRVEARAPVDIMWTGALVPRKNPMLGVKILRQVLEDRPQCKALMVGSGPLREDVESALTRLPAEVRGRIQLISALPREKFRSLLAGASTLLVTSVREANSVVVLEALALGVCVVSANIGGLRDTVGKWGWVYELGRRNTVAEAASAVQMALDAPLAELAVKAAAQRGWVVSAERDLLELLRRVEICES